MDMLEKPVRTFVIGCNRSGSTLLFTILNKILGLTTNERQVYEDPSAGIAFNQCKAWISLLDEEFIINDKYASGNASTKFNGLDYYCAGEGEFVYLAHLPIERYRFDNVHRTYSILSEKIVNITRRQRVRIFCPIRNPLDIIVSNAFEMENLLFWMYPKEINDATFDVVRRQYGLTFLRNLMWFESMANLVKEYDLAHIKFRRDTNWVKYEDLISQPIDAKLHSNPGSHYEYSDLG